MPKTSPEFDAYIEKAAPFAQPILARIRKAFHKAHPEVEEVMKWSFPHFEYKGVLGSMAAFKQHVSFGFWKGKLMDDPHGLFVPAEDRTSMVGVKVRDVKELPSEKVLVEYVQQAIRLNEEGVKIERPKREPAGEAVVPPDLAAELKKNSDARKVFEKFSPSAKREYIDWITEAKQEATRKKRLATAIEWIAEGKQRHWKYAKAK